MKRISKPEDFIAHCEELKKILENGESYSFIEVYLFLILVDIYGSPWRAVLAHVLRVIYGAFKRFRYWLVIFWHKLRGRGPNDISKDL